MPNALYIFSVLYYINLWLLKLQPKQCPELYSVDSHHNNDFFLNRTLRMETKFQVLLQ